MSTKPTLPDDEEPLDAETLDAFLASMGSDTVLVGGQALGFWMQRYGLESNGIVVSNDGDALAGIERARRMALALRAALVLPDKSALTALVAQIRIPTPTGRVRNIDVLRILYTVGGLKKSIEFTKQVQRRAVGAELKSGLTILVMHPVDLLISRVNNAAGLLEEKGLHVVTQAQWAIQVARVALVRAAENHPAERVGPLLQEVARLAKSSAGRTLRANHGLEVLDAVDTERLGELMPKSEPQLSRIQELRLTFKKSIRTLP